MRSAVVSTLAMNPVLPISWQFDAYTPIRTAIEEFETFKKDLSAQTVCDPLLNDQISFNTVLEKTNVKLKLVYFTSLWDKGVLDRLHYTINSYSAIPELVLIYGFYYSSLQLTYLREILLHHNFHVSVFDNAVCLSCDVALTGQGKLRATKVEKVNFTDVLDIAPLVPTGQFAVLAKQGIPCSASFDSNEVLLNVVPSVIGKDPPLSKNGVSFSPPFQSSCKVEAGTISSLLNVRISGSKNYLYTEGYSLVRSSIANSSAQIDNVIPDITNYEPSLFRCGVSLNGRHTEGMWGHFNEDTLISETVVIISFADIFTYHHWLFAFLPRFWCLDEFEWLAQYLFVIPRLSKPYQQEFLSLLGVDEKVRFLQIDGSRTYRFKHAIFPSLPASPHISSKTVDWLRNKFSRFLDASADATLVSGRFYISRNDSIRRPLINEEEVEQFLGRYGFVKIVWSDYSVKEQIAIAGKANFIVAAHGSNLSNTVFCPEGTKIIELWSRSYGGTQGLDWISFLNSQRAGKSIGVICDPDPRDSRPSFAKGMVVPIADLQTAVENLLSY
jgi:hypothetical protein